MQSQAVELIVDLHTAGHRRGIAAAPHHAAAETGRMILAELTRSCASTPCDLRTSSRVSERRSEELNDATGICELMEKLRSRTGRDSR